ncbi:MAG: hypothetical protein ACTTJ2_05740 [Anaerovoracaceae bacterium]
MMLNRGKKDKKGIIAVCVFLCMLIGAVAVYAASPGSDADPVVTKSYVDTAVKNAISGAGGSSNTQASAGGYEIVHLKAGQSLLGNEGTEIILRSGRAAAIDNGANGVSDMTAGTDLRTGDSVQANHLLLVPRADGRGLSVSTEAYLMVRGGCTIN